jgi:hypothetical protein
VYTATISVVEVDVMAPKYRAQILLEPEQHTALAAIAAREGRSVSEVAREVIGRGLDDLAREAGAVWRARALALERLDHVRVRIEQEHGVFRGDLLAEARADRERQVGQVLGGGA